jgi:PAS domain S-box-containing protein
LSRRRAGVTVVIRDDGTGFDPAAPSPGSGFGLVTMRERAALMGAELVIRSRPRRGTEVRFVIPADTAARPATPPPLPPLPLPASEGLPPMRLNVSPQRRPHAPAREIPAALDLALFRQMADMSLDSFYLIDVDGRFRYVNQRSTELTGYSKQELLRMSVFDLDPIYDRGRFREVVDALAHGVLPPFETRTVRKDGSVIATEATVARIDRGGATWLFGVVRDLTEQKEAETAQLTYARRLIETLEAERQRVARELHDDVGQAVATIGVLLHTLERPPGPDADRQPALGTSHAAIQQIADSVSRIVREYHPAELLGLGLEDTLRSYARQFAHRHRLELELATTSTAGLVPGEHELHLYRIAQEALTNVARHAQARRVTVRLAHEAGTVRLVIRDDGRGFDPAAVSDDEGTAFGLTTMRERAAITGAHLHVRSAPGRGTEVRVVVPLTVVTPAPESTAVH